MSVHRFVYAFALLAFATAPASLPATSTATATAQDWTWRKVIPAGKAIEIKGVIGTITATPATGNEVEVVARKTAERSDPSDVEIVVVEHAGGATICAIYPTRPGKDENECLPGAKGSSSSDRNDTEVDFDVRVPRGVRFTGKTVVGDVEATGMTADVEASSVSGSIRITTTGLAEASTVSGSIRARMGRADWDDLGFTTVSGSITLELPDALNTDVSVSTLSGNLESDWPITTRGTSDKHRWGPRRIRGTIGSGGRELSLATVSGDIELRKID